MKALDDIASARVVKEVFHVISVETAPEYLVEPRSHKAYAEPQWFGRLDIER